MPGPKEPKGYELDQILKPLVSDLIGLLAGVNMKVFNLQTGEIEMQTVYATLLAPFVNWIARIKCTGHVGIASKHKHCLYCKIRQCYLSLPQGYQGDGYEMRDPVEHLQLKHKWLCAPVPDQHAIFQENGTLFTEFNRIPGFYAFNNAPIDGMHLFDHAVTPSLV
ncbi:hypothetical protein FS749_003801 [Ceratobasidium sp. UAMH 11750]|nr:hypothetical protein FS749_003801 [Ceratobasidium sp. UAMH 11750]